MKKVLRYLLTLLALTVLVLPALPALPVKAAPTWTLVVIPDPQFYTSLPNAAAYNSEMNYAVANADFVVGVGDLVDDGAIAAQWAIADAAWGILDTANIPYLVTPGNHDSNPVNTSTMTNMQTHFPPSRFGANGYYPAYPSDNYKLATLGGRDYIFMSVVTTSGSLSAGAAAWANSVLTTYSSHQAIIVSHGVLNDDPALDTYSLDATIDGREVWSSVARKHSNVILVLSGNYDTNVGVLGGSFYKYDIADDGHQVWLVTSDFQVEANGGNGWMRILTFDTGLNTIDVTTHSSTLPADAVGAWDQYQLVNVGVPPASVHTAPATPTFFSGAEGAMNMLNPAAGIAGITSEWTNGSGSNPSPSTLQANTGTYSWRYNPVAGTKWQRRTLASTPNTLVMSFAVRFTSLPDIDDQLLLIDDASGDISLMFDQSTSQLFVRTHPLPGDIDEYQTGTITTGTWYTIDIAVDSSADPTVVQWRIDGVTQQRATVFQTADVMNYLAVGSSSGGVTADFYYDDIIMSETLTDYPIGQGKVRGYIPDSSGGSSFNLGDFKNKAGANIAVAATNIQTYINRVPMDDNDNDVQQVVINAAGYLRFGFTDTTESTAPIGVQLEVVHIAAVGVDPNDASLNLDDGGVLGAAYTNADISSAGLYTNNVTTYATPPSGGTWTIAKLNALNARWGYSADVDPIPILCDAMLEVAWADPPVVTTSAASSVQMYWAAVGGNVTGLGTDQQISRRGIAYSSTNATPTISDSTVSDSGSYGTGTFVKGLPSLHDGTTYYARAFATNSVGTGYGSVVTFATIVEVGKNVLMRNVLTVAIAASIFIAVLLLSGNPLAALLSGIVGLIAIVIVLGALGF